MKAHYYQYVLQFKRPSGTSRGVLTQKETWFIVLESNGKWGIGECGLLRGLSIDDKPDYESTLAWTCAHIDRGIPKLLKDLEAYPSIQFGLEQAARSLNAKDPHKLFSSPFTEEERPIVINGLVWMGNEDFMLTQIEQHLTKGFSCIKLKIGAIAFEKELALLRFIRQQFPKEVIEIRVDANGAFKPKEALDKLQRLAEYELHSIEQPIMPKNWEIMAQLCSNGPLPIALDEELIGIVDLSEKQQLLKTINPQYVILKPSLIGGYKGSEEWIALAEAQGIGWWVTSALESNIGLNAIAQWAATLDNSMPQGLGTGSLFTNNIPSPLEVDAGQLFYRKHLSWPQRIIAQLCT
ncbi:MAG: o-succinylbenzoate synthase [Bacteroidota bacterium]